MSSLFGSFDGIINGEQSQWQRSIKSRKSVSPKMGGGKGNRNIQSQREIFLQAKVGTSHNTLCIWLVP